MHKKFEYVTFISAPASDVWEALTKPEIVQNYYLAPLHEITLKKGGRIAYGLPDDIMIEGEIVMIEDGALLAHTFSFCDAPDEAPSRVEYIIANIGEVTQLTLTHDGLIKDSASFEDVKGGWPIILSQLKTFLETGNKLPWPEPQDDDDDDDDDDYE